MATIRKRIQSGSAFEKMASYCRAVVDDYYIHISGTVGVDPETGTIPDDIGDQAENIFAIVAKILTEERATLADVVRCRVYVTEAAHVGAVAAILGDRFRGHPPTNTTLICGIPAPGAKVEIEMTAIRSSVDG